MTDNLDGLAGLAAREAHAGRSGANGPQDGQGGPEGISGRQNGAHGLDIEAIRARAEAATPGPWNRENGNALPGADGKVGEPEWFIDSGPTLITYEVPNLADAEFIANAREDVPALLDEVERLAAYVAMDAIAARSGTPAGEYRRQRDDAVRSGQRYRAERDSLRAAWDEVLAEADDWDRQDPEEWARIHSTVQSAVRAAQYSASAGIRTLAAKHGIEWSES